MLKRLKRQILVWRYRRLYEKLFWHYAQRYTEVDDACVAASNAFLWLTMYEWEKWAPENLPIFPPRNR